jgi:hypothetical protein
MRDVFFNARLKAAALSATEIFRSALARLPRASVSGWS